MVEEYLKLTMSTLIMLIGFWQMSDIVFEEKSKKGWKDILVLIMFSLVIAIFNMNKETNVKDILKIILVYFMMIVFNRRKYKVRTSDILIGSTIVYGTFLLSELLLEIILIIIHTISSKDVLFLIQYTSLSVILVMTISWVLMKALRQKYLNMFKRIQNVDTTLVSIVLIIFLVMISLASIIPIKSLNIGLEIVAIISIIVTFSIIGIYIILEKVELDKILGKYHQLSDYAKINERLLEDYRVNCHENKNHLIIIDNMVPKSNKKVHEYIRSILDHENMNKYYFINELKNIPITELKGFINYKSMEMLNEGINLQINISEQIKRSKLRKLTLKEKDDLYNIIGVLLDNASEASIESKEKEVILEMHKEKSTVVIMIANTYRGEVEIDKISEYGYSSKGRNHGTGLYIVEKIISKNKKFTKETSLMDNYFVQTIKVL